MKTGIELITEERKRQIEEEGFDSERDDQYTGGELAQAAAAFAHPSRHIGLGLWPRNWAAKWFNRQTMPSIDERIRQLAKSGALGGAEIDRLQRLKAKGK
jgi:hypothetical protein